MTVNRWLGKRVLILGAARQGMALARFLARHSARVTMNDRQPADKMVSEIGQLSNLGIDCVFGSHPLEILQDVDLVCISGGIPLDNPIVREAEKLGIPLSNDTQVFMEEVKAPVIAITGSAGKTTTTALLGKMAELACSTHQKAWVGGNIGLPLVDFLDEITKEDIVILEVSSFQLEQMTISPHLGAILNITPNHLDRHGTLEAYTAAKTRMLQFQKQDDYAILNRDDPASWSLQSMVKGKLVSFGISAPPAGMDGSYWDAQALMMVFNGKTHPILKENAIQLRGAHNKSNVQAAATIAFTAGFPVKAIEKAVASFKGVPHRLEHIRTYRDSQWFNDSIATAPERTMAAIKSFSEPLVLLLGGRDKNLPWQELASLVHERVDHVIVFGESAEMILHALGPLDTRQRPYSLTKVAKMHDAVVEAAVIAERGDVVLLSPGGTSFDEFRDFEERGEKFREWVNQLQ